MRNPRDVNVNESKVPRVRWADVPAAAAGDLAAGRLRYCLRNAAALRVEHFPLFGVVDAERAMPQRLMFASRDDVARPAAVALHQRVSVRDIQVAKALQSACLHQRVQIRRSRVSGV